MRYTDLNRKMNRKIIGEKVRSVRELRHMTRETLAEKSGLELMQLKALEEGSQVPALSPLGKVAHALGVRLGTFLDDAESWEPDICRKADGNRHLRVADTCRQSDGGHLHFYAQAAHKQGRNMEPFVVEIDPAHPESLSSHEGEEFLYVLAGEVGVRYGDNEYRLDEGDSIYFDSIVQHSIYALSGAPARLLAVLYVPF